MNFAIIDESTPATATADLGGPIAPAQLTAMAAALMIQANRDVALYWGGQHVVRVADASAALAAGEVVCAIVDTLPDAPGDVAYHDVTGNDLPVIFVSRAECSSVLTGSASLAAAMSHEIVETIGDPDCNRYAQDAAGLLHALELADATQEDDYLIDGVSVSNFLLPSFFATRGLAPWSFNGNAGAETVGGPFATASGGYQLTMQAGATAQIQGSLGRRAVKVCHWSSRVCARLSREAKPTC